MNARVRESRAGVARHTALRAAFASLLALPLTALGVDLDKKVDFHIPAQDLSAALIEFSKQAHVQVIVSEILTGRTTQAVTGQKPIGEALRQLLEPAGLRYRVAGETSITVGEVTATETETTRAGHENSFIRLAQADPNPQVTERLDDPTSNAPDREALNVSLSKREEREAALQEVVVTGTRIKEVKDQFSPVTTISRDAMDLSGFANLSDLFESLPGNFGDGVTPDATRAGSGSGAGGAGVNLRGLGNESTLVLLNGKRLAPGGANGSYVDISAIPTSAIERVEIVPDSASAIYGADAVGGVANIILRDDFAGAETRVGLGTITDGGNDNITLAQTVGASGERAHGLLTYQYSWQDELNQEDKDFAAPAIGPGPSYLLPESNVNSALGSAGYRFANGVALSTDAYFNDRHTTHYLSANYGFIAVANSQDVRIEQSGVDPSITVPLSSDWEANAGLSYSHYRFRSIFSNQFIPLYPEPHVLIDDAQSSVLAIDMSVGGSLFAIAQTPVSVTFGGQVRTEKAEQFEQLMNAGELEPRWDRQVSRRVQSGFVELYVPLVEPGAKLFAVHRLALTAATRYDDYSDIGGSWNPRVGAVWSPTASVTFRGTFGTSFRPARLDQLIPNIGSATLSVFRDPDTHQRETALIVSGNPSQLDPEKAHSWTAGVDLNPQWLPRFSLRATYFNIDYRDRLGFPTSGFNPAFEYVSFSGKIIHDPDPALVQSLADEASTVLDNSEVYPTLGGPLSLSDVTIILDERLQNLARTQVEGVDLSLKQDIPLPIGNLTVAADATLFLKYTQQASALAALEDILNTYGHPVDVRYRIGAQLTPAGSFIKSVSLFVNHVGAYTDDRDGGPIGPIAAWTTLDASMAIQLGGRESSRGGASLVLSVVNLTNEDPPTLGPRPIALEVFDTANANPAGRRIQAMLTKRW